MAIFSIDKINYVVTGSSEQLINVKIEEVEKSDSTNRNFTFVTDLGPDMEANHATQEAYVSASYKTHRLWKLFRATSNAMNIDDNDKSTNNKDFIESFNNNIKEHPEDYDEIPMPQVTDCKRDLDTQVYALFDAKDIIFKSGILRKIVRLDRDDENSNMEDADRYVDVYSPRLSDDFMGFVQYHKAASLGMTEYYPYEPYMQYTTLRKDRESRLSNDSGKMIWHFTMDMRNAQTFSYTPVSDLRVNSYNALGSEDYDQLSKEFSATSYYSWLTSFEKLSADKLSMLFEPRYNLSGIPRNYIANLNMASNRFNDFNSGVVTGDFIYAKNPYNAEYSMCMPARANLSGVRKYVGLGTMGGKPFLKYYDDNMYLYKKNGVTESSDPRLSPKFPYDVVTVNKNSEEWKKMGYDLTIQDVPMRPFNPESPDERKYIQERQYQNVEIFESMNRGLNSAIHKSNLYSVKIRNLNLNSSGHERLDLIKQDIKNTVRKICKRLEPAHTQLFNVNIDGTNNYVPYVSPAQYMSVNERLRLEFGEEIRKNGKTNER